MKKAILTLLIVFLLASKAFSFTIITDPNVFYAFYEKPTKVINFTELKDGTSYNTILAQFKSNTPDSSESDCLAPRAGDFEALTVLPGAFSKVWSFRGSDPESAYSFCDTILWFDQGISTGNYHMAISTRAGRSQPFAIYTNKGFMGILPDTPKETLFIFENLHFIFSFETDFSKTTPMSESRDSFLAKMEID